MSFTPSNTLDAEVDELISHYPDGEKRSASLMVLHAKFLSLILQPPNNAIAVIGATFGGCGNHLVITANVIIANIVKFL